MFCHISLNVEFCHTCEFVGEFTAEGIPKPETIISSSLGNCCSMVELTCMKASSFRETEQHVKNESSKSKG
jgi:hypothetical protein